MTTATSARRDQAAAAANHASAVIRTVAAATGSRPTDGARIRWLQEQVDAFLRGLQEHGRFCSHIGRRPQVLHGALWAPGRVYCSSCASRLQQLEPDEDARCDRCRRIVCPIHPSGVAVGALIITFGLCGRCCHETGVPVHPDSSVRGGR